MTISKNYGTAVKKFHESSNLPLAICLLRLTIYILFGFYKDQFMKTAVFGGTFDPVHLGHTGLAKAVLERGYADRVLFVPAALPPHKDGELVTPFEIRLELLRAALGKQSGFQLDPIESERDGKSYTIDTMRLLSARHPGVEFLLLIGTDSLRTLHLWHQAGELAEEFRCLIYPRRSAPAEDHELLKHWPREQVEIFRKSRMTGMPEFSCSSSEIREALISGHPEEAEQRLDPAVFRIIREKGIYHGTADNQKQSGD